MPDIMQITWNVILVILGVNALIIVHEFGHFIVARMCGVRCDKFYIWFDIYGLRFFRFKWGQTEYGLGVLPLGGYVKMFGQEDNPGQIAKEIERAKAVQSQLEQGEQSADIQSAEPLPTQEELQQLETALYAKDSYLSKSVPQRMAIISAGVIMNFIFAFICATAAFMIGTWEKPCAVGGLVPGSPAWAAGLQVGDHLVEVDGKKIVVFSDLMNSIIDGDSKGVHVKIERPIPTSPGNNETIEKVLVPEQNEGALVPTVGIVSLSTAELIKKDPLSKSLKNSLSESDVKLFKGQEKLVAINDQPITSFADIARIQGELFDQPLRYTFQEGGRPEAGGGSETDSSTLQPSSEFTVSVAPILMNELGIRFEMGEITAIKSGSAAEELGIAPGDTLVDVDGLAADPNTWDPMKLPQILLKKALANVGSNEHEISKEQVVVSISVKRKGTDNVEEFSISLNPAVERLLNSLPGDAVACSALGIAYQVKNVVAAVDPAFSSAGESQIPVGAVIEKVEFPQFVPPGGISKASFLILNTKYYFWTTGFKFIDVGTRVQMPFITDLAQIAPEGTLVRFHAKVENVEKTYDLKLQKSKDWFKPERGFYFAPEEFSVKGESFAQACKLGYDKTVDGTLAVYRFLKNIGRRVSAKAMGGPVTIVKVAYDVTSNGMAPFLLFLCLIGANLAVLNILPIPVLDGGHLVFLLYEAIFRKPAPESIQIALSYLGLFLLLSLMVWAISLDLGFISRF